MSSYLRGLADSLAAGLQSVAWSPSGTTVERKNWAAVDVEDMATPRIIVVPGSATMTRASRTHMQTDYTVNVFVGRHVATDLDVDAMYDLADAVSLRVRAHAFSGVSWPSGVNGPQTVTMDINPDDAMNDRNVWRAVIVATYIVFEPNTLPSP